MRTPGFSCVDLANLLNEAAILALQFYSNILIIPLTESLLEWNNYDRWKKQKYCNIS
ncbi:hypothetical protein Hdeb2414_s0011g00362621 [Helianthus debilis subsp. tardiflorus]